MKSTFDLDPSLIILEIKQTFKAVSNVNYDLSYENIFIRESDSRSTNVKSSINVASRSMNKLKTETPGDDFWQK